MKCLLSVAMLVLCAGALNAATIHIPTDQSTIQAGIDAASDGDTVLVAPGLYTENIVFGGHSIVLLGSKGADSTILTPAEPNVHTVVIGNGELPGTEFRGFTV
ncbi:MAG: hypothetical protein OEV80_18825, partial [candidate division Zixibacteria bacterium]|nr:hypothetical protein [candidate division Zixibacteria bacterium]